VIAAEAAKFVTAVLGSKRTSTGARLLDQRLPDLYRSIDSKSPLREPLKPAEPCKVCTYDAQAVERHVSDKSNTRCSINSLFDSASWIYSNRTAGRWNAAGLLK
jgi:hypothetical protein